MSPRKKPGKPDRKVLVLTETEESADIEEAGLQGITAYVPKWLNRDSKLEAFRQGLTFQKYCAEALREHLAREKEKIGQ